MAIFTSSDDLMSENCEFSFSKFPEDVQFCILSFLSHIDLLIFSCTSKRYSSLCGDSSKLWYAMCDRRWGSKTEIRKWSSGNISFKFLYRTLKELDKLIGFWRISGNDNTSGDFSSISLVYFEWGSSFITAAMISPSKTDNYHVIKTPFLWMSLSRNSSRVVCFLGLDFQLDLSKDFINGFSDQDPVPINVIFMGSNHIVIEENRPFYSDQDDIELQSSPNSLIADDDSIFGRSTIAEIYHYFANRLNSGGDKSSRKYRKREKAKQRRMKLEPLHLVKIVNSAPTLSRPLEGLWKGIGENMKLEFYLVVYDDVGGIVCRKMGDSSRPVFWSSSTVVIEAPLSREEEIIYENFVHLGSPDASGSCSISSENKVVSGLIYINSSYDLVIPQMVGALNSYNVEGRAWLYTNGMFGFGFLRDNFIVELSLVSEGIDLCGISITQVPKL